MATLTVKAGDTVLIEGTDTDDDIDMNGATLAAQIQRGTTKEDMTASVVDAGAKTFKLEATSTESGSWETGTYFGDVKITQSDSTIIRTVNFKLNVLKSITA